jgi:hypothetical protein
MLVMILKNVKMISNLYIGSIKEKKIGKKESNQKTGIVNGSLKKEKKSI